MLSEAQLKYLRDQCTASELSLDKLASLANKVKPIKDLSELPTFDGDQMDEFLDAMNLASGGKSSPSKPMPKKGSEFRSPKEMRVEKAAELALQALNNEMICGDAKEFDVARWESLFRKMFVVIDRMVYVHEQPDED